MRDSIRRKLRILADAAKYDASCASSGARRRGRQGALGNADGTGICHSYTPDGRCVSLLKILLTNYCIFDCKFCVNRVSSETPRARFTVDEIVYLTTEFYRRNYIEGLFLSSGILRSPDDTMRELVAVAERLRRDAAFNGYVHLKVVPGASEELVERAGRVADRLSVNVELPTERELRDLAPEKDLATIEDGMRAIRVRHEEARRERRRSRRAPAFAPAGQSTQMVVGAGATSDREILGAASRLYDGHRLRRIYYSAYSPHEHVAGSLPPAAPPLAREHRLYQADWLMRFYGFDAAELTTEQSADLDLDVDPKLAWALRHPERFPVELDHAPRRDLLRVPGLGRRSVQRILALRRHQRVRLEHLRLLRVPLRRARHFIVTADHRAAPRALERWFVAPRAVQLSLLEEPGERSP